MSQYYKIVRLSDVKIEIGKIFFVTMIKNKFFSKGDVCYEEKKIVMFCSRNYVGI